MSIRYELCPQMKVYDQLNFQWKPFVMFSQPPEIRTEVLNTDIDGIRYNNVTDIINKSVFDNDCTKKDTSVLLGGSTAFGVGSTKDSNTLSGYLSNNNNHCFNLASRSYVGLQEIIIFLTKIKELKGIKKLTLLSGINDFYMLQNFDNYSPGGFYFNDYFQKSLNYKRNALLEFINYFSSKKLTISQVHSLKLNEMLKLMFSKTFKQKILNKNLKKISFDDHFERYFLTLSLLSKCLNIKFQYILQPYIHWCKDLSIEEKDLIEESLKQKNVYNSSSLRGEVNYKKLSETIKKFSEIYSLEYLDFNEVIRTNTSKNDWIFVDSIHLNDAGYKLLSKSLILD